MKPPRFLVALVVLLAVIGILLAYGAWRERQFTVQRRHDRNDQQVAFCDKLNQLEAGMEQVVRIFRPNDPRLSAALAELEQARCDDKDLRLP